MFFSANNANDPRVAAHWNELTANRAIADVQNTNMIAQFSPHMSPEMLAANNFGAYGQQFWAQIDREVNRLRSQEFGMEILDDLGSVQKTLPIGKTAMLYRTSGDIADDVAVSIDGQAPYSFDHVDGGSDGDPIPVFTAGFGVNWRLAAGLNTQNIDLVLESQEAKQIKFQKRLVNYMLNGDSRINVDGKAGQGLKNHRNTKKVNLGSGAGGANIDLTTATAEQLIAFFTTGAFGTTARANRVGAYDKTWVSHEIHANLSKPYVVNGAIVGTVLQQIKAFAAIAGEITPTFALSGNEYLSYQRRSDVVSPLVGMTTGVVALPRLMPQSNHNFQIMGAIGLSVRADYAGRGGVQYGANLA